MNDLGNRLLPLMKDVFIEIDYFNNILKLNYSATRRERESGKTHTENSMCACIKSRRCNTEIYNLLEQEQKEQVTEDIRSILNSISIPYLYCDQ